MCLAQFATHYSYVTNLPKRSPPTFEKGVSLEKSNKSIYYNDQKMLPQYIDLSQAGLGKMKLRSYPSVMRIHNKKEGEEKPYSEMMLYYPWRDEKKDLCPGKPEEIFKIWKERTAIIDINKKGIFHTLFSEIGKKKFLQKSLLLRLNQQLLKFLCQNDKQQLSNHYKNFKLAQYYSLKEVVAYKTDYSPFPIIKIRSDFVGF